MRRSLVHRLGPWLGLVAVVALSAGWFASRFTRLVFWWTDDSGYSYAVGVERGMLRFDAWWRITAPFHAEAVRSLRVFVREENKGPHGLSIWETWPDGSVEAQLPVWIPLMLVAIPTGVAFWRTGRKQPGHCRACRYDLTGNTSGRCPECGMEVAPVAQPDRTTVSRACRKKRLARAAGWLGDRFATRLPRTKATEARISQSNKSMI